MTNNEAMEKELADAEKWACCHWVEDAIRAKYRIAELEKEIDKLRSLLPDGCGPAEDTWTQEPLPESLPFEESFYFFAELHKGEWIVTLENISGGCCYKPNANHWRRSENPVCFPAGPD